MKQALAGIAQGIDVLQKGQQVIIENQQKTFEKLLEIQDQVAKNMLRQWSKLDEIHTDILINRESITDVAESDISQCGHALTARYNYPSFNGKGFLSNSDLFRFLHEYADHLRLCFLGLDNATPSQDFQVFKNQLFYRSTSQKVSLKLDPEKEDYLPLLGLFKKKFASTKNLNGVLKLMSIPPIDYTKASKVMQESQNLPAINSVGYDEEFPATADFMDALLSPAQVKKYVDLAIEVAPYRELLQNMNPPVFCNEKKVFNGTCKLNSSAKQMLKFYISVINTAIAQQRIMDGDFLFDEIAANLRNSVPPYAPVDFHTKESFIKIVTYSPILQWNFIMSFLKSKGIKRS